MDVVLNLPVSFVNKLRDVRIEELQEQKREMEEAAAAKSAGNNNVIPTGNLPTNLPLYGTDGGLSDILDEYT